MADINFDCPLCGQNLDAPDDMSGLFIECPACAKIIKVPAASTFPSRRPPPPPPPPVRTPAEEKAMQEEKGSTIPIKLPHNLGVPERQKRRIIIKRR